MTSLNDIALLWLISFSFHVRCKQAKCYVLTQPEEIKYLKYTLNNVKEIACHVSLLDVIAHIYIIQNKLLCAFVYVRYSRYLRHIAFINDKVALFNGTSELLF